MATVSSDPPTKEVTPSEPVRESVRIVEVPNNFLSRLTAVTGAIFHPFSTTVVRVMDSKPPSQSMTAIAEADDTEVRVGW